MKRDGRRGPVQNCSQESALGRGSRAALAHRTKGSDRFEGVTSVRGVTKDEKSPFTRPPRVARLHSQDTLASYVIVDRIARDFAAIESNHLLDGTLACA